MTVYCYARVSTSDQAEDNRGSISAQIDICRAAATIARLPKPVVVIDPGVSGATPLSARPEGGKMVASLVAGDTVIAAKLDRLFRSAADALNSVERMKNDGIKLILVDIGTDPVTESAVAKMFLTILAGVAEFEKNRILERMAMGREFRKKAGGHIGGDAPYGFKKTGSGKTAMLVPDESEQATTAIIVHLHNAGLALRKIATKLFSDGVCSRNGKMFAPIQLQRILTRTEGEQE